MIIKKIIFNMLFLITLTTVALSPQNIFGVACSRDQDTGLYNCSDADEPGAICTIPGVLKPENCKYAVFDATMDGIGCRACCYECNPGYVVLNCDACTLAPTCTCSCSNNPNACNRSGSCSCSGDNPNYATCNSSCNGNQTCCGGSCVSNVCGENCSFDAGTCTCVNDCPADGSDATGTFIYTESGSC